MLRERPTCFRMSTLVMNLVAGHGHKGRMATGLLTRCLRVRLHLTYVPVHNLFSKAYSSRLIREALDEYEDIEFMPLRIRGYILGRSFTSANVDTVQYLEDRNGNVVDPSSVTSENIQNIVTKTVSFQSLFKDGFKALQQNADGKIFPDYNIQFVTQAFISGFIQQKDFHESCLRNVHRIPEQDRVVRVDESYIATLLANHLFSKLTARFSGQHFFMTNDYKQKFEFCPCMKCGEEIQYGNSGIGSEFLWYGYPDIMVFTVGGGSCNIVLPHETNNDETINDKNVQEEKQLIEVKKNTKMLRNNHNIEQFVSQAITFSFYQRKRQLKSPYKVSLIPTIAVSADDFDIYIYDSVNDILLRNKGSSIPLWKKRRGIEEESLKLSSVLKLWMVLNHLIIKPQMSEEDLASLSGTCDFLNHLPSKRIKLIEKTVSMQKRFSPITVDELDVPSVQLSPKLMLPKIDE